MGRRRRTGCALLATLVVAGTVVPAAGAAGAGSTTTLPPAERRQAIDAEIADLEETVDEVAAEEEAIQGDLEATQARRAELDAVVAGLADELATARAALRRSESVLEGAIAENLRSQERRDAARGDLAAARRVLREQAVTAYVHLGSPTAELDVYLGVADLHQLHGARVMVDAVVEAQARAVDRYHELSDLSDRLDREAVAARAEADRRRDDVVVRNASVEELHADVAAARAEVAAQASREESLLAETRSRKSSYEARIVALKQESDGIAGLLQQRQVGQGPGFVASGVFGAPLVNPRITSRFGYRVHPIFGTRRLHAGIDFGAPTGTPILAAADGVVAFAGVRGGYGNAVVVDHGGSLATLYAHQSRIAVTPGATVRRGQVIGYVGATGFATGPHLHFEVRANGTPVDPLGYL